MPNLVGYSINYDGVASSTIPEYICQQVTRQLVGERRHTVAPVPGLEGGWVFPEAAGMRLIKIDSAVLASTWPVNRRAACRAVANWLDKPTMRKLIIGDEPNVFNRAILNTSPDIEEWRQKGAFSLEFMALPYTYDTTISSSGTLTSGSSPLIATITAGGDVFTEPVIEVTAPGSGTTLNSFTLNGRVLGYATPMAPSAKITINCISKVVTTGASIDTDIDGTYNSNNLSMTAVSGQFLYLLPGANTFEVSGTPAVSIVVKWRNRYR
jgi:predicted phage tail component-like protein